MPRLLTVLARIPGPLVTGFLASLGSFGLGFAVMTDCTNNYSCSSTGCDPCSTTNLLLIGGWVLQGLLFLGSLALFLPSVVRRLRRSAVVGLALAVPVVSVLAFAATWWAAESSYCRPDQDVAGQENYCDVEL